MNDGHRENGQMAAVDHLINVIKELSTARDLSGIMRLVRTAARRIVRADGATFVLKDGDFCFYADEDAISPLWKGQRFPLQSCISGWAMIHKRQAVIEDIDQDARIPHEAYRPTFVRSLVMTPIRTDDPIAAIGTYWAARHAPTEWELRLLQSLADTVSVAMENINLYRSLERRIDQLAAADRAKDEFLMSLSHELRTPLSAVLGWADVLLRDDLGPQGQKTALESILRNAKAQIHIVDDLLDTSSVLQGRLTLVPEVTDLVPIAREVMESFRPESERKRISLRLECQSESAEVWGDRRRLRQILVNLVGNALKFSSYGGREIVLLLKKEGPTAVLRVSDHGVGIAADLLTEIFEPFKRVDSSLTREHGGLGLGLGLVRALVEAHHGEVTAESQGPGQGATFTVSFPCYERLSIVTPQAGMEPETSAS